MNTLVLKNEDKEAVVDEIFDCFGEYNYESIVQYENYIIINSSSKEPVNQ